MRKSFIIVTLLILSIFGSINTVRAESLKEWKDKLVKKQAEYRESQNKVELTQGQINTLNKEIESITASIEQTRKDIKQAEEDIEKTKKKIEEKKVETDGMLQFLQVSNGGNIYLEYLFDAENYTDFIYRYEVVKQLTNYNSDLIDEFEALILDLQKKEKELAAKQVKLENERKELNEKVSSLTRNLANYRSEGDDIEADIRDLKKQIDTYTPIYQRYDCAEDVDVDDCTGAVNAFGFKYPLTYGCVTSEYTGFNTRTDWSGGGGHHAIDLSCVAEGTKVFAAANGTVSRIAFFSTCGGNTVYINHYVNGKRYTTQYMHLLSVAAGLYVGKEVTDTTVIGYMGGFSTSVTYGGYDYCTTGAHLHFGVAEGYSAYDFNSHSINPREVFSFPALVYSGGGYFSR